MALEYKCTRLQTLVGGGPTSQQNIVTCYYVDTTTNPATPGQVTVTMTGANIVNPTAMRGAIDMALTVQGSKSIDWTK